MTAIPLTAAWVAAAVAGEIVAGDPYLTAHPALAARVAALVDAERAEYLEKT